MRKILLLVLCFGLFGCAELQQRANEYSATTSSYFANPQGKLMVTINALNEMGLADIQCHCSSGSLTQAGSNNSSFRTYTPYVTTLDLSEKISALQANYNKLPKNEKRQAELYMASTPLNLIYVCQNQGVGGIVGKIYFNGKEVSSDVANVDYGVVNLSFTLSLNDVISDKQ